VKTLVEVAELYIRARRDEAEALKRMNLAKGDSAQWRICRSQWYEAKTRKRVLANVLGLNEQGIPQPQKPHNADDEHVEVLDAMSLGYLVVCLPADKNATKPQEWGFFVPLWQARELRDALGRYELPEPREGRETA